MAGISQRYAREMHDRFGYLATWLPNVKLRLGDVGVVRNQVFEPTSSLSLNGITFAVSRNGQEADLDYASSDAVSIETRAVGATPAAAGLVPVEGSVSINFKRADAVVFQASGCVSTRIEDQDGLGREILALYARDAWTRDHVVVTDLVIAQSATILISNGQNAKIDLALKAQAPGATRLADGNVSVVRSSGIGTRIVSEKALTPLFKVSGIQRRWLAPDSFARRSGEPVQFGELTYKDLV